MGIITEAWFNMLVAWHSLFIIAGIYTMIRKHYLSGGVLLLAGLYLLGSKLMLFPGNFQAMLWPLALSSSASSFSDITIGETGHTKGQCIAVPRWYNG